MRWEGPRREVLAACGRIVAAGLVAGSSGNVSRRTGTPGGPPLVAITPSRVPYSRLRAGDILVIDLEGALVEGRGTPSSETPTHLVLYGARPDIGAVVHTHSVYASVLAVAGLEIPALIDEQVVVLGGPVPVAEYAVSGSEELARNVCDALGEGKAVLLRNHGALGVGADLEEAVANCELLERIAQVYVHTLGLNRAQPLPDEAVAVERELFRRHGRSR